MKIVIDHKTVKRYGKFGTILRWASIGFLAIGVYALFTPTIFSNQNLISVYFGVMIVGVLTSSLSNYLTSRYGRSPRPDELLDKALKGLDDKYTIYHYQLSIPHLLVSPSALYSLIPTFVDGKIVFDEKKNTWVRKGGSFLNRFLAREAFSRPDRELEAHRRDIVKFLKSKGIEREFSLQGIVVILSKNTQVEGQTESNEITVLPIEKMKEKIRRAAKTQTQVPAEIITAFQEDLNRFDDQQ